MLRLLTHAPALLVFFRALTFPVPLGHRQVVCLETAENTVVVTITRCCIHCYATFVPGMSRRQIHGQLSLMCQEIDAQWRRKHFADPDAIDIGEVEFYVPRSRRVDCGGELGDHPHGHLDPLLYVSAATTVRCAAIDPPIWPRRADRGRPLATPSAAR